MATQLPSLVSLFLCDELVHDAPSGKTHVFGLFDSIRPRSFPHRQARVGVFVAITDVAGTFASRVRCLGPDGSTAFGTMPQPLKLSRPNQVLRVFFRIVLAPFRRPGIYRIQFLCVDQLLVERPFIVLSARGNGDV